MIELVIKVTRNWLRSIGLLTILFVVSGCLEREVLLPEIEIERSVLIYMAANNNLSAHSFDNIEALKRGYLPSKGNIVVYHHAPGTPPRLFRLVKNKTTKVIEEELIEQYDEGERSTDPVVLTKTLLRVQELFPSDEYGLILWSHATGWKPATLPFSYSAALFAAPLYLKKENVPLTKSFGTYNADRGMELNELAEAIPFHLSFILFDACLMGSVEVVYALREKTDYIIASPTEILGSGFPYESMMEPIFRSNADLSAVCAAFYTFYSQYPLTDYRSGSISLYGTQKLPELAATLNAIFDAHRTDLTHFSPYDVQHFANTHFYYDLDDFVYQLAPGDEYDLFKKALDNVVLYTNSTEKIFTKITSDAFIPILRYGGVSTYIPIESQTLLKAAYKETEWNRSVHLIE